MDGHLFLFIENVTKYVIPHADVICILVLLGGDGQGEGTVKEQ